ncbi:MAG TPA: hypothetical protein DDW54_04295 [Clostridiales bacterium]|nr:hypothetical protein [Clostridiales bacterium]
MDNRCIIFYDSGIGGLNLLKRTYSAFPEEDYLYYGDFENMPYGNKTEEEIVGIVSRNLDKLIKFTPKLIVIACNTASTVAKKTISEKTVETIGVFPTVGKNGKTVLICTEATAKSGYVRELKEKYPSLAVFPEKNLARDIEKAVSDGGVPEIDAEKYKNYDYVSLGCTHYTYIKERLLKIYPPERILSGEDAAFFKIRSFLNSHRHSGQEGSVNFMNGEKASLKRIFSDI